MGGVLGGSYQKEIGGEVIPSIVLAITEGGTLDRVGVFFSGLTFFILGPSSPFVLLQSQAQDSFFAPLVLVGLSVSVWFLISPQLKLRL